MGMIQEDLNDFCKAWNKHGLRTTAGNRTPEQLLLLYEHLEPETREHVDDDYGREEEDESVEDVEQVVVLPLLSPLSEEFNTSERNSSLMLKLSSHLCSACTEASRCLRALRQR